ncbi:zinc finger protein 277-like isoform X2 [Liolophura sinensis]|uniref:zinc finger protein 277-like isoform X2 n=1 Tax=Liolophura sinensis TaxID=3198878 RepID=UPI003158FBDD
MAAPMEEPATTANTMDKPVLETLNFCEMTALDIPEKEQNRRDSSEEQGASDLGKDKKLSCLTCPCLLCDKKFDLSDSSDKNTCLEHLLTLHRLVIGEVELIADLKAYFRYWKERFKGGLLSDFCTSLKIAEDKSAKTSGVNCGHYFLLCDVLPEDKDLRQFLQKQKLAKVLDQQERERNDDTFSKDCVFCRKNFSGRRADLINHMASQHDFNIGSPDNLVFVDEFLDIIQSKLNNLLCLYCEKLFKDRWTLKEHMRKKHHRRINPENKTYDKFYVINYLELGKNWEKIKLEEEDSCESETDDDESETSEWTEDPSSQAVCLFCTFSSSSSEKINKHLHELHDFDLEGIKRERGLNFYQQVKLVNFIRRQIHQCLCYGCSSKFQSKQDLLDHMHSESHIRQLPKEPLWDQPEYFFPTYENDNLLCQLEDWEASGDEVVEISVT